MDSSEYIFVSFSSLLVIINVLGNSLVILVILKDRSMKTPINYLLLNLAVADLMVGIFVVPRLILDKKFPHPRGLSGDIFCKFITRGNLAWLSTFSSVFSLVFIAFERYYAIMKPLSIRHRITTRKLKIFIPIFWTLAVILATPYFYFGKFDEHLHTCQNAWPPWITKVYYSSRFFVVGILPTSIMAVFYSRIIHLLWCKQSEHNAVLQAVRRSRKNVTKTMLTLSVIYVLCWFPDNVMHTLEAFLPSCVAYPDSLHNAFNFLIVLNSTVNPIIYAFQFKEFMRGLKKIVCCKERCGRIHVAQRNYNVNTVESRTVNLELDCR